MTNTTKTAAGIKVGLRVQVLPAAQHDDVTGLFGTVERAHGEEILVVFESAHADGLVQAARLKEAIPHRRSCVRFKGYPGTEHDCDCGV